MYKKLLLGTSILASLTVFILTLMALNCNNTAGYYCGLGWIFFVLPITCLLLLIFLCDTCVHYLLYRDVRELYPLYILLPCIFVSIYVILIDFNSSMSLFSWFVPMCIMVCINLGYLYRMRIANVK